MRLLLRRWTSSGDAMVDGVILAGCAAECLASGCDAGSLVEVESSKRTSSSWSAVGAPIMESAGVFSSEGVGRKSR